MAVPTAHSLIHYACFIAAIALGDLHRTILSTPFSICLMYQPLHLGFLGRLTLLTGIISIPSWASGQAVRTIANVVQPVESQALTKILFGSCIKQDRPMPILQTIVQQHPDLFIFLGDNIYADTVDMNQMRAKYARLNANLSFKQLIQSIPVMATWDDHDYGANDAGADYSRRAESEQIFLDHWGEPAGTARRTRPGVYDAKIFGPPGKRVQVILLDTRYFRGPLTKGERRVGGPYVPSAMPDVTMLGDQQWRWLDAQLKQPAELRIIASSIQCVAEAAGQETWSNLPKQRQQLFDRIANNGANGVVILSGDRHWAELSVTRMQTSYPIYDLTSSSLNQIHARGTPTENQYRALPKTYHLENYGAILIDWEKANPEIHLQILDQSGTPQIEKILRLSELQKH
ncbi:MAG: alkaline phosphatase D family protein [Planctomycetota bacterium]|nr:alkaline phosphatase D family protein [Planctomycetota bacterium]